MAVFSLNKDTWIFSAVVFTMMEAERSKRTDPKAAKQRQIYMAVKARLGLFTILWNEINFFCC